MMSTTVLKYFSNYWELAGGRCGGEKRITPSSTHVLRVHVGNPGRFIYNTMSEAGL